MSKFLLVTLLLTALVACHSPLVSNKNPKERREHHDKDEAETRSEAAEAMDFWSLSRTFPDGVFQQNKMTAAFQARKRLLETDDEPLPLPEWHDLGPKNIGGRTLALAFHPSNPNVLWAASAGGGLWKSTSGGRGQQAWQRVRIGFPVLAVAAIAVADSNTIYIGTGEVYNYRNSNGSVGVRTQRGSYGIGILKTTDGGATWTKSLDWSLADLRGVEKIMVNPLNKNTVFATTTEGVYRSYNAGKSWQVIDTMKMAVDFDIAPNDTNRLFATFGCLDNVQNGIFRSTNGGNTWTQLTNGLPTTYSGKAMLDIAPTNPSVIYASIADNFLQIGLYKTTDGGDHWTLLNAEDVAQYQGWYAHDVAVSPRDANVVVHVGIDAWLSTDGGATFRLASNSGDNFFGKLPVGGAEGLPDYVHADIHGVHFSPFDANTVWFFADGGVYQSSDLCQTFAPRNGGYQTAQFYANFSNSAQDSLLAMGGLQDNFSAIYTGDAAWTRRINGDGMCTAINPQNDSIMFGSSQGLNVLRSFDRGATFNTVPIGPVKGTAAFCAPFEIAPSNPQIMYAGSDKILKSTNGGASFSSVGFSILDNYNPVNTICVNETNPNTLFCATFPSFKPQAKLWKSMNGGKNFTALTGLPNRVYTDIAYSPRDSNMLFVTLGGFGSPHLFRTSDGGATWEALGDGLPDLPTNSVVFDPLRPQFGYVGNDLGVYFTSDTGRTWRPLVSTGFPEAAVVMHLSLSLANRKLRVATHGSGVFQIDLLVPQHLRMAADTVFCSAKMEGTNEPVRVDFVLKNTHLDDTIIRTLNASTLAPLPMPRGLPLTLATPPQYPFPHPEAVAFNDSIFPFKIAPSKSDALLDGISTYDIALVSRHVLGIAPFTSPFKLLAADVNGDGSVDALDMLLLRRLVLRIDAKFANAPMWLFVPKTFTMPNPPPPFSEIPMAYFFNAYSTGLPLPFEFIVIKVGDVNNSFDPSQLRSSVQNRNAPLTLTVENKLFEKGKNYDISLKINDLQRFIGLQGTLKLENTEGVEIVGLSSDNLKNFDETNFYLKNPQQVAFSWNDFADKTFAAGDAVLTLKIHANETIELSKILTLNSDIVAAEAINQSGEARPIQLKFTKPSAKLPVFTAEPNPFLTETTVKFDLDIVDEGNPDSIGKESIQYAVFDESGKQLFARKEIFKRGANVLTLTAREIGWQAAGFYFLKIETADGVQVLKLQKL